MGWTKGADWLPVKNAIAQVKFWKRDLIQAEDELNKVEGKIEQYPTLDLSWLLKEAQDDVDESTMALKRARDKLQKTLDRVG